MKQENDIRKQIYDLEDKIRTCPADTPNKVVFDWYIEIDQLKEKLSDEKLPEDGDRETEK